MKMLQANKMLILIFLFFLTINVLAPPQNDDWLWEFSINNNHYASNAAALSFQKWNARIGELLYLGYLLPLSVKFPFIVDLLNAIVSTIFIYLTFFIIFARAPKERFEQILLLFIIVLCVVSIAFEECFLWLAGSLNYLWAMSLVILCILPHRIFWQCALDSSYKAPFWLDFFKNPLILFIFCALNIAAGMAQETFSVVIIALNIISFIIAKIQKIKLPFWYFLGFLAFVLGFLILYFAPAASARIQQDYFYKDSYLSLASFFSLEFKAQIYTLLNSIKNAANNCSLLFCIFYFFIAIWELIIVPKVIKNRVVLIFSLIIFISIWILFSVQYRFFSLVLIALLFAYIAFKIRNKFFIIASIIFIIYFLAGAATFQISSLQKRAYFINNFLLILPMIFFIFYYLKNKTLEVLIFFTSAIFLGYMIFVYVNFNAKFNKFVAYVESQKAQNSDKFMQMRCKSSAANLNFMGHNIDIIYPKSDFVTFNPMFQSSWWLLGDDVDGELNKSWACYFGVKTISIVENNPNSADMSF